MNTNNAEVSEFEFIPAGDRSLINGRNGEKLVRIPRGITRKRQLLATLASAFHFPDYFGHNWDALEECLNDLSWLGEAKSVRIVHADLPCAENRKTLAVYLDILRNRVRSETPRTGIKVQVCFPDTVRPAIQTALASNDT